MLLLFPWLFSFLAFAPRCGFAVFEFVAYSGVQQCGPFNVSFSGGQPPAALPLTLTVIPFDSIPLSFTIPESAWDSSTSSGSYVTVLPLPSGVSLMASLDDAAGNSAALTSDVIQVLPSTDTSCISANQTNPTAFQLVDDAVSQCSPFNVSRNNSHSDRSLSVRVFIPTGLSFNLKWKNFHTSQGVDTFTYIMDVASGLRVAMLFDDGHGTRQVSDLISVGGGASSPSGCLQTGSAQSATATRAGVGGLSRPALIAISVASSVTVVLIVILGVLLVRRERRKFIRRLNEDAQAQDRETNAPSPLFGPLTPKSAQIPAGVPSTPAPVDPVYPQELFNHPGSGESRSRRTTILAPFVPWSVKSTRSRSSIVSRTVSTKSKKSTKGLRPTRSLVDLDIAGLLEEASQQPAATEPPRGYPGASPHTVTPVRTPSLPPSPTPSAHSTITRSLPLGRSHQELDVPLSPLGRFSEELHDPEQLSVPAAAMTVSTSRNGLSSRRRPLPTPPRGLGILTLRKDPARF